MKVAVIGAGYWGPNLARNFLATPGVDGVAVYDVKAERLKSIKHKFPTVEISSDESVILRSDIDAVVISTPVDTHYHIAKKALEAGKHIWVEKPFTSSSAQAETLIELAEKKKLQIFVDHTFIYTGAVQKIKEIVNAGELGDIFYFDSVRINLGLFQHDVNVIWDLAPHDLSIMNFLILGEKPVAVSATGIANYYDHENVAHLAVYFKNNCFAHFHLNWTSPVKIRRMILSGNKKMLVFDDMENFEKIKVYDSSVKITTEDGKYDALVSYRIGDMYSPKVNQVEALALGAKEFVNSIKENRKPLTNGEDGLAVVKILEASSVSIKSMGKLVEIN